MCSAEICFFCVPLDWACLILGCITFVLGAVMGAFSISLLVMESTIPGRGIVHLECFPELVLNTASANILLTTTTLLALLWMLSSVMLLIGIKKNNSNYVLWYFSFGIFLTILCLLSGLLVLVEGHWIIALVKIIISLIYIHCLTVVHTTYDLMQTSTVFKSATRHMSDEAILVESTEELSERAD